MAKKKKRGPGRPPIKSKEWFEISQETKNGIWAIVSFSLSVLTILGFVGKGGKVGNLFTELSQTLFGWGFFIIPVIFILMGVSFIRSFSRKTHKSTFVGLIIFLLGVLGVFFIFGDNIGLDKRIIQGGYLGVIFGYPLLSSLGFISSLVVLIAILFISILIALDIPLHKLIFSVKPSESEEEEKEDRKEVLRDRLVIKHGQQPMETKSFGFGIKKIKQDKKPPERRKKYEDEEDNSKDFIIKTSSGIDWKLPPLDFLRADSEIPKAGDIAANAAVIKRTLANFGIDVEMGEVNVGPTVTQYTLRPAIGVKLSKITALHNDIALALASHPIRIEAPIPGKSLVGIEVPNKKSVIVGLKNLLELDDYQKSSYFFPLALGRNVAGYPVFAGLEKMPHVLVAGATGTGKSVCINSLLLSLIYKHSPDILKFILIDPKRVELSLYNGIPHLITPVITDNKKAINALRWLVKEMEKRYEIISAEASRDIFSYNTKQSLKKKPLMPFIVLIIDELADLMIAYGREIEASIVRLAQMSRAVGIHLIISTQRPSVEVITGLIKANITSRIAFQVATQVDSRTILDTSGAEKLLGNGDMLYLAGDTSKPRRIQGALVSEKEVKSVVKFLKSQKYEEAEEKAVEESETLEESLEKDLEGSGTTGLDFSTEVESSFDDPLFGQAKEVVIQARKASASLLQRRLRIGYARAARLIDMLEEQGIVGPSEGAKPRQVLIKPPAEEEQENQEALNNLDLDQPAGDKEEF